MVQISLEPLLLVRLHIPLFSTSFTEAFTDCNTSLTSFMVQLLPEALLVATLYDLFHGATFNKPLAGCNTS